jgi:pyruvate dehydrogenase E2 component (dihydrolipoamide acetyltransferase)
LARRIADELKIDITTLRGTGPDGRVIKRDVEQAAAQRPSGAAPAKAPSSGMGTIPTVAPVKAQTASLPTPSASAKLESKKIPLSSIRQTIARRLLESKLTIPHFYLNIDVQMDALLTLRGQANAQLTPEKLSVTDFIARAVAVALARVPAMNASFGGTDIVQHGTVNLGIAVALDDGLVVPVLRDAHLKGVRQLSAEIKQLAELARSRKLKADQMTGSTFTISNLGMYGVKNFQAIVNPPEAAILAVGGTSAQAVAKDGQVAVAQVMNLSLSCDHRVIDGATGAKFLGEIKTLLEQPLAMLI